MSRMVKCRDDGNSMKKEDAFRDPKGRYWSSERTYKLHEKILLWKKGAVETIESAMVLDFAPPLLKRKINELSEKYGADVVFETSCGIIDSLRWAAENRNFENDMGKIFYAMAVMENNVGTYLKRKKREEDERKRNDEMVLPHIEEVSNSTQKVKDISQFL